MNENSHPLKDLALTEEEQRYLKDILHIMSLPLSPSQIMSEVEKYATFNIEFAANIIDQLLFILFVSTAGTIASFYNQLIVRYPKKQAGIFFIRTVADSMWRNFYVDLGFDEDNEDSEDTDYIRVVKENFDTIRYILSALYSAYFMIACSETLTEKTIFLFVKDSVKNFTLSVPILVATYFQIGLDLTFAMLFSENEIRKFDMSQENHPEKIVSATPPLAQKDEDIKEGEPLPQADDYSEGVIYEGKMKPFLSRTKQ